MGLLSIVAGVVIFLSLPMKLMPFAERNQFAVEIYMPLVRHSNRQPLWRIVWSPYFGKIVELFR